MHHAKIDLFFRCGKSLIVLKVQTSIKYLLSGIDSHDKIFTNVVNVFTESCM